MSLEFKAVDGDPELIRLGLHAGGYRYDFESVSADLLSCFNDNGELVKPGIYYGIVRSLARRDLFFLMYFVLDLPVNDPYIVARIYEVQDAWDSEMDLWFRGGWKAIDIKEPVLTPDGFKEHGLLEEGDYVYAGDGFPVKVTARTPIFTDARCYRVVFDDGYGIICSGDHLWVVERRTSKRDYYRRKGRERVVMSTEEMKDYGCGIDHRLSVWVVPVEFHEKELPIAPYTLGAWLGDGHSSCGRITCGDEEVFKRIRKDGYCIKETTVKITKKVLTIPLLRHAGVLDNKHIPEIYKAGSITQRMELLRGLMDTDGTISDEKSIAVFVNTNERLSRDVFDLCLSLGFKARVSEYWKTANGKECHYFHVSFPVRKGREPFFIKRKVKRCRDFKKPIRRFIVSIEETESIPVSCIEVEGDGSYLVGRNLIVTHNSSVKSYGLPIWLLIRNPEERIAIFSHTRNIAKDHLRRVKTTLETNMMLRGAFPEIFYENTSDAPRWNEDIGVFVKRKKVYLEASLEAWGLVDNLPTGKHFTVLIFDDIIDLKRVNTAEMISKTTTCYRQALLLSAKKSRKTINGTIYAHNDTYADIIRSKLFHVRKRTPEVDDKGEFLRGGKEVYLDRDELEAKFDELGEFIYNCQMGQDARGEQYERMNRVWLTHCFYKQGYNELLQKGLMLYGLADPGKKQERRNDLTAFWVIGTDAQRNYWVLDAVRDRMTQEQKWQRLRKLVETWGVNLWAYEHVGLASDREYMERRMMEDGVFFTIMETQPKNVPKRERINNLISDFKRGRILFPDAGIVYEDVNEVNHNLVNEFLTEEYDQWPRPAHDDMLDALSLIYDPKLGIAFPSPRREEDILTRADFDPLDMWPKPDRLGWMAQA